MIDRSSFSMIADSDLTRERLAEFVEALDAGLYAPECSREERLAWPPAIRVPALVHRKGLLPRITFIDPTWDREDDKGGPLGPLDDDQIMNGDDDAILSIARSCLSAPWTSRTESQRHHGLLMTLAMVSAADAPEIHPNIGASAATPWGEASTYQAVGMIGGMVTPTPTNVEIAAFVPRLVSVTIIDRTVGIGPSLTIMPHGYRLPRSATPDAIETLRMLGDAKRSATTWTSGRHGPPVYPDRSR